MTPKELYEILNSDKKLTVQEVKNIICQLKDDTIKIRNAMVREKFGVEKDEKWINDFVSHCGEGYAYRICLDLLDKVGKDETSVFEDIKTGLEQAIEYEKENKKC